MKHLISTTLLLITFLSSSSLNAQQISSANYNEEFIQEDFNQEGDYFKIVTTTDNYFVLDKGDYLLSRNNKESEYAIIANNSSVSNFILKTALRLGPNNNKKASIGIVLKSQLDGKGAIIFEINKKGEYRIKQLLGNTYKTLSGRSKCEGWVKNKIINGVDEHNFVEIRTENNIYDVYINSDYLTTFYVSDYNNGSCGIIISAETKARISYYHINTKGDHTTPTTSYAHKNSSNTNTTIEGLEKTITENTTLINNLTNEKGALSTNVTKLTETTTSLNTKNVELATITIEQEKEINTLRNSTSNSDATITKLNTENEEFSSKINSLNTKNEGLATATIEQEKEIVSLKSAIKDLKSKSTSASSTNKQLTENIDALKQQVTLEKSVSTSITNDLNKVNKSSNSKIKKLTAEVNTLKNQLNINTTLSADLSAEKIAHSKTKNGLSNSVTNKTAEIKALEAQLNTTSQQLKSANKNSALAKEYAKNATTLTAKLKNANQEITVLENIKNKHDDIVNDLNSQLSLLKTKQLDLKTEVQALNKKTSNLETTNIELKELFILKDFEVNGIKPSELTKQTNTYPTPKEIKGTSTIYAVQFGVFMQMQAYSTLKALDDVWYETTEKGTYVYLSGEFKNPQEATAHKNKVAALGYTNAFVVTLRK